MSDFIIVLNAGSSSLKFTIYTQQGESLRKLYGGQIEGILTNTRFKAKDDSGKTVEEKSWPADSPLNHEGAVEALFAWGRGVFKGTDRVTAVGHRVVHGGLKVQGPRDR